jgi:hypothetical protein
LPTCDLQEPLIQGICVLFARECWKRASFASRGELRPHLNPLVSPPCGEEPGEADAINTSGFAGIRDICVIMG